MFSLVLAFLFCLSSMDTGFSLSNLAAAHMSDGMRQDIVAAQLKPWTPINWRTLPVANDTDVVEVYYLIAPLMEDKYGKLFGSLHAYHGALAFLNKRTNFGFTVNYDAFNFVHSSLFPTIVVNASGHKSLQFDNGGGTFVYAGINQTYWTQEKQVVATISGALLNKFMQWNSHINATHPYYNLLGISQKWNATPYVPAWTCFDYVFLAFDYLQQNGANFSVTAGYRDFSNIYSSAPLNITLTEQTDNQLHDNVIGFYEVFDREFKSLTFMELIYEILATLDGVFYIRISDSLYQAKLHYPYAGLDWYQVPFKA